MNKTYSLAWGYKIPLIQKITLSGLFIALACILNKVLAVNYIPAVPFVRVSFGGPAIIMFSAYLFGPIYGSFIGAMSDVLGYLVFDMSSFMYSPFITITYGVLGLCSGLLFYGLKKINSKRLSQILTYSIMSIIMLGLSLFIILKDDVVFSGVSHHIDLWMKIVFPLAMAALFTALVLYIELANKKDRFKDLPINIYSLTLGCFLIEVFVMTLFGSWMKSMLFGSTLFPIILFCQSMTMFFNIPFNVIILSSIMKLTKKYYEKKEIE